MDADSEDEMGHSSIQFEKMGAHLRAVDALTIDKSAQDQCAHFFSTNYTWEQKVKTLVTVLCGFEPSGWQQSYSVAELTTIMGGSTPQEFSSLLHDCLKDQKLRNLCRSIFHNTFQFTKSRERIQNKQVSTFNIEYPSLRATDTKTYLQQLAPLIGKYSIH